jgi:NAD(P)-dependent dehydrogenase (short-subunit alcohol dehydrogenase family)
VTRGLVKRGATVILACRNITKAHEAIKMIQSESNAGKMIAMQLDLASFEWIKNFTREIKEKYPKFDCLINNAGLAVQTDEMTVDGIELHTGTNHIGPFLLTNLLLDDIKRNNARVVIVGSRMYEVATIDLDNLGKFTPKPANESFNHRYNSTKLMNFHFAKELFKRGIDVHVCCPGFCGTSFFRNYKPVLLFYLIHACQNLVMLRTPEQGAQSIIYCALENVNCGEKNPGNSFIVYDCKQNKAVFELDDEVSERLWVESAKLCGLE